MLDLNDEIVTITYGNIDKLGILQNDIFSGDTTVTTLSRSFACAVLFSFFAVTASAGTINYTGPDAGGWQADDVWYGGVSESNTEGPGGTTANLFGAPTVAGNAVDFNPTDFVAESTDGGFDITDGQLNFMVVANPGKVIDNLQLSEAGDTTIGGFPSTDATFTTVTAEVFIDVLEVDGSSVTPINLQASMTFTPSDGDFFLNTDSGGLFVFATAWNGSVLVDINQGLIDAGVNFTNGATKINVAMDNTLSANSILGTSSFIKKKDFDGLIVTSNVPEPTTTLLALLAVAGGIVARRR